MSKLIVIDQLHVDLLIANSMASREVDGVARHIRKKQFLNEVRELLRAQFRESASLANVVVRVTR